MDGFASRHLKLFDIWADIKICVLAHKKVRICRLGLKYEGSGKYVLIFFKKCRFSLFLRF